MKKNIKRRTTGIFILLIMALVLMPIGAYALCDDYAFDEEKNTKYAVEGGYIYFDEATQQITRWDSTATNAVIPEKINGITVRAIGEGSFWWSSELESVTIPDTVTRIREDAFLRCDKITEFNLSKNVTQIGTGAFSLCNSLKAINVDKDNPNYTSVNGVLFSKDKTRLISYPCDNDSSYVIPEGTKVIENSAFTHCHNLEEVKIPGTVTKIEECAFDGCSRLKSITVPDSVSSICDAAFMDCSSIKTVKLGKGLKTIGMLAFSECSSIETLVIPEGVTDIGAYALEGMEAKEISLPASFCRTTAEEGDETDIFGDHIYRDTIVYVPEGSYAEKMFAPEYIGWIKVVYKKPVLSGLKHVSSTDASATVKWTAINGASGYDVYCGGKLYKKVTEPKCTINSLSPGKSYTIKVRAKRKGVTGDFKTITVPVKPGKVAISKVVSGKKCLTVKWKKKIGTGYQVAIAKNGKFTKGKRVFTVKSSKTLSKKVTKLTRGSRYYVKVRAYKTAGGKTVYGKWSKAKQSARIK